MNPNRPRCEAPALTEVERLLTSDQRRPRRSVTVEEHAAFRESIAQEDRDFDEIDLELLDPPQKRSERETNNVLKILDELERGSR